MLALRYSSLALPVRCQAGTLSLWTDNRKLNCICRTIVEKQKVVFIQLARETHIIVKLLIIFDLML